MGVELSEIVDGRTITKQKILNQIAIHAREIEKTFEPRLAALQQAQPGTFVQPKIQIQKEPLKEKAIPEPVIKKAPSKAVPTPSKPAKEPEKEEPTEKDVVEEDHYVKPSEFLKKKGVVFASKKEGEEKAEDVEAEKPAEDATATVAKPKTVSYPKRKSKKKEPVDRTPSPELIQVFDVFIKYLEAITDNKSFNDLCDKIIEQLYEHIGSPGMTQVYKIKSGGVKRKQLLIDLIKKWKGRLPDL